MKIFRNILSGTLIFLCLFCSCSCSSGGMDTGGSVALKEKEVEKEAENSDEDENEDETEEDETEDISNEIPPALVFLNYETVSEKEIVFRFSQPVSLMSLDLKPELNFNASAEGSEVKIKLAENPKPGLLIEVDLQVKDEHGNTDSERITFHSKNNHVPKLQINELRTEYDKPKAEFIEFKMLSGGNLGALRVFAVSNSKVPQIYEFAPMEVKEGEYVVLHLRKLEGSSTDECGEDLSESDGKDSCPTVRDLWIQGSSKLLRKTDAVYVLDQDDNVLDAVMITENPSSSWDTSFAEVAEFLFDKGAWKSPIGKVCSPTDAVNSSKTTPTRTICRDENVENTHTAADWYITANSGVTPGQPNNPKRL